VDTPLVRSTLVLDHSGFATEALQATFVGAFVRALSGVNSSVTSETRRLGPCQHDEVQWGHSEAGLTSENRLPQPMCWH
jgi:hypothetical protein